jgi:hypothetical protein
MTKTTFKHPTLSSKSARIGLNQFSDRSEIQRVFQTIDNLRALDDALEAAMKARSPEETPEARAMRYAKQYEDATSKARELTKAAVASLDAFANAANASALERSGLSMTPPSASEIRTALRSMDSTERRALIEKAAETGDVEILASIYGKNPILWGGVDLPMEAIFTSFVDRFAPERAAIVEAADTAAKHLELAYGGFHDSALRRRDPAAIEKGERMAEEFSQAEAMLRKALSGNVPSD